MSNVHIYQCGSCSTRYANLPGMSIRCPECGSKERELILSESILDLAKRFIDLQKLNEQAANTERALNALRLASEAFGELEDYDWPQTEADTFYGREGSGPDFDGAWQAVLDAIKLLEGTVTEEMIEDAKTESGGWTKETLAGWGVPWPPPKGWKEQLFKTGRQKGKTNLVNAIIQWHAEQQKKQNETTT